MYYTATRGILTSPVHKYFNTIEELNSYYGIKSTEDDYNRGFSFEYDGKRYFLWKED